MCVLCTLIHIGGSRRKIAKPLLSLANLCGQSKSTENRLFSTQTRTHNTDKRKSNWMTCSFLCFPISFYCCTSQIIINVDNKRNECTHWIFQGDFCVFGVNRNTSQRQDEFAREMKRRKRTNHSISVRVFSAILFIFPPLLLLPFEFPRSEEKKRYTK